jgi:hypothetical protein
MNGVAAIVTAATASNLTVKVPLHAGSGKISVRVGSETANSGTDFTYIYTVSTLAGEGSGGFKEGDAATAQFNGPVDVAVDASGNVYVVDYKNFRIREITPAGVVSTLAGDGTTGFKEGAGSVAKFNYPLGVGVDGSGNVYVADAGNNRIRRITPAGIVSTLAGDGSLGFKDGVGTAAKFDGPFAVAIDGSGKVYVVDYFNSRLRSITPAGEVSTLAGGTYGFKDGAGKDAQFEFPTGVAVDTSGNIYVADPYNGRIRKTTPDGVVSTQAGDGTKGSKDGTGSLAQFMFPSRVAADASGNIYVADENDNRIRKITAAGVVTTLAGDGTQGFKEGAATTARFNGPAGVAVDASGNIYVADYINNRIRKLQ